MAQKPIPPAAVPNATSTPPPDTATTGPISTGELVGGRSEVQTPAVALVGAAGGVVTPAQPVMSATPALDAALAGRPLPNPNQPPRPEIINTGLKPKMVVVKNVGKQAVRHDTGIALSGESFAIAEDQVPAMGKQVERVQ